MDWLSMYAIIETGGKQYKVKKGDSIGVELLKQEAPEVSFPVLLLNTGNEVKVGSPHVLNATVKAKIENEYKDKKVVVFKYKKRKNYRVKKGHRQRLSKITITAIEGGTSGS
jgi:large subunit ribosomal protein L21